MVNKEEINKLKSEIEDFHYKQSSKASLLARTLVYGMIGTIWLIIYSADTREVVLPNKWLITCLILCFTFLIVDLCHYLWDSWSYRKQSFALEKENDTTKHEQFMNKVSKRSFVLMCIKCMGAVITSIIFIIGILCLMPKNKDCEILSEYNEEVVCESPCN